MRKKDATGARSLIILAGGSALAREEITASFVSQKHSAQEVQLAHPPRANLIYANLFMVQEQVDF